MFSVVVTDVVVVVFVFVHSEMSQTTIIFRDYAKWNANRNNPTNALLSKTERESVNHKKEKRDKKECRLSVSAHMNSIQNKETILYGNFDPQFNSYFY